MEPGYGTEYQAGDLSDDQARHQRSLGGRDGYDPGFHGENLYDENEGPGGEVIDLRSGKKIDNSSEDERTELLKMGGYIAESEKPTENNDDDDEAAHWLAEHDKAA